MIRGRYQGRLLGTRILLCGCVKKCESIINACVCYYMCVIRLCVNFNGVVCIGMSYSILHKLQTGG